MKRIWDSPVIPVAHMTAIAVGLAIFFTGDVGSICAAAMIGACAGVWIWRWTR